MVPAQFSGRIRIWPFRKKTLADISSSSGEFDKMREKTPLLRPFSPIFDDLTIFAKVPFLLA